MALLYSDQPIDDPRQDELEVAAFAQLLIKPLVEWPSEDPLVMALYGLWGQGKSSTLNLLKSALGTWIGSNGQRAIVLSFNPWLYENTNALLASFFGSLARELGTSNWLTDEEKSDLRDAIVAFGELAVPVLAAFPVAGPLLERGLSAIKDLVKKEDKNLESKRRRAQAALRKLRERNEPRRVVVLVDDLDRLENPELRMMLRLVKLVADLPNVSYVLAVDHARLRQAMASEEDPSFGEAFLEKIVQVPIHLPIVPDSTLERLVKAALNDVLREAGLPQDLSYSDSPLSKYLDFYPKTLGRRIRTLRDRARLVNALRVMLMSGQTPLEVHQLDAVLVAFLQTFYPDAYERVRRNKQFLTEGESIDEWVHRLARRGKDPSERKKQALVEVASGQPGFDWSKTTDQDLRPLGTSLRDVTTVEAVLNLLFPRASTGDLPSEREARELRIQNRIQLPERFDRYFYLRLPADEVRDESVVESLSVLLAKLAEGEPEADIARALTAQVERLDNAQRRSFVSKLRDRLASVPLDTRLSMLRVVMSAQDQFQASELYQIVDVVAESFGYARGQEHDELLGARIVEAVKEGVKSLRSPLDAVLLAAEYRQRDVGGIRIDPAGRVELAREGLRRMQEYIDGDGNVFADLSQTEAGNLIWRWRDLLKVAGDTFNGIKDYLRRLVANDLRRLPAVLSLFGSWSIPDKPEEASPSLTSVTSPRDVLASAEQVFGVDELRAACVRLRDELGARIGEIDPYGMVDQFIRIVDKQQSAKQD